MNALTPSAKPPFAAIARHLSTNHLRSSARTYARHQRASELGTAFSEDHNIHALDPLAQSGQAHAVRRDLAALDQREREAIELAFFDSHTHGEIAHLTGTPLGTVKARIRRGTQKLKPPLDALRQEVPNSALAPPCPHPSSPLIAPARHLLLFRSAAN